MKKNRLFACLILLLSICFFEPLSSIGDMRSGLSNGQTIYVPAYSHIYSGDKQQIFQLTVTLSIRNVDPLHQIKIAAVDYYETQGKLQKKFIDEPIRLNPLESIRYIIPQKDKSGGSGANFIVKWQSEKFVNSPIIETIMIGTQNQQGVSFTSRGRAIASSD